MLFFLIVKVLFYTYPKKIGYYTKLFFSVKRLEAIALNNFYMRGFTRLHLPFLFESSK